MRGKLQQTPRARRRLKALLKACNRKHLSLNGLRMEQEKRAGLLRVKQKQHDRLRQRIRRREADHAYAQRGTRALSGEQRGKWKATGEQADAIAGFWRGIWGQEGRYRSNHPTLIAWKADSRKRTRGRGDGDALDRDVAWGRAVRKQPNWKAPGPDRICAYWYKAFPRLTELLRDCLWRLVEGDDQIPAWFVEGRTVLIPKSDCEGKPEQFRPITCLNCMYKALTGALTHVLMDHAQATGVLPNEQKALRKGCRGCLDALTIDDAVAREARTWRRNLSVGWVDYQKAYDRTPHPWVREVLKAVRAPKLVRRCLGKVIPLWRTHLEIPVGESTRRAEVQFKRGLYQGDSLSPLLFCLCVAPLSLALKAGGGFLSRFQSEAVTHLIFMDDLKIYEESGEELEATLGVVEDVSDAVGMRLGLRKCAVAHMRAGKLRRRGGATTRLSEISEVSEGGAYRYLGIEQVIGTKKGKVKERVRQEYLKRTRATWASPLKTKTKVRLQSSWCAGVLRYFCGPVDWTRSELVRMDRATRAALKRVKAHHKNASVERVHLPRHSGGRGVPSVEHMWEREKVSAALYLLHSKDPQVRGAMGLARELDSMCMDTPIAEARRILHNHEVVQRVVLQ